MLTFATKKRQVSTGAVTRGKSSESVDRDRKKKDAASSFASTVLIDLPLELSGTI